MSTNHLVVGGSVRRIPKRGPVLRSDFAFVGHLKAARIEPAGALGVGDRLGELVPSDIDRDLGLGVAFWIRAGGWREFDQRIWNERIDVRSVAEVGKRVVSAVGVRPALLDQDARVDVWG